MPDPRLVSFTRHRIEAQDFDAVFTAGGCFVFAIRLQERFGWKIRGTRHPAHVWAVTGGKGVDVRGAYPESILSALANGGETVAVEDFTAEEVQKEIAKKEYPPELLEEMRSLADRIFDAHERYVLVRPPKPEVEALFARKNTSCR
ncbi:MAG TPA: hypothetical protein VHB50_18540 [Bryobacteraceae bacterium]|nr:hypothetical protein [Bryobacteraceae bacterium]